MKFKRLLILAAVGVVGSGLQYTASAQSVSLKTNALYWATATPNIAAEITLSPRMTIEIGGAYNPAGSDNGKSSRFWLAQPELRWWFTRRFAGTFVGIHAHTGNFNLAGVTPLTALKNNRYDGWLVGAGIGIGRHWLLGARWGIEFETGFGFAQMEYHKSDCVDCINTNTKQFKNTYIGLTRLSLSLVYNLR